MPKFKFLKIILVCCGIAVATSACSSSSDDKSESALTETSGLLKYVPADTPYVLASPEPMPQDVLDKLAPHIDAIFSSYKDIMNLTITDMVNTAGENPQSTAEAEKVLSVAVEFGKLMSSGDLNAAGLSRKSRSAFYGVGLLPVLRVELTDPGALDDAIAQFEENTGESMSVASIGEQSYRYVEDESARLILALIDNYLVATIVPTELSSENLSAVLGLTLPTNNIAAAGTLDALAKEYGYSPHALGFLDIEALASIFIDAQSGVNAEVLSLMAQDKPELSDVCRAEIRAMSGIMPRVVAGYTEVSVDKFQSNMVLELRNDIAAGLATLAAVVPGLGTDHGGLFSFGMSLDLLAAREFYTARLDAMEAEPYQCELFAELQNGVAGGRAALNQPVPPIAYGFKGFLMVVDDIEGFDIASQQPPTDIDMRLLVAIDNAEGLLAMGTMFSPELAALNLQPDGKAVKLETALAPPQLDDLYVVMNEQALGAGIGSNAETAINELLVAAPGEPLPSFSMHMDAASYYGIIGDGMMASRPEAENDSAGTEMSPEVKVAVSEIMTELGELLDRISVEVTLTQRGVEIPMTVTW